MLLVIVLQDKFNIDCHLRFPLIALNMYRHKELLLIQYSAFKK